MVLQSNSIHSAFSSAVEAENVSVFSGLYNVNAC